MIIYSHRGYKKKENSKEAILNSFKYFDGVEFDVRLSKDNIPIVVHDYNLFRTHNVNKIVHHSTYLDLKQYNIQTLDVILNLIKLNNKKCLIDIKVKNNSQYILNYLEKIYSNYTFNELYKCIVYTDNIKIPKYVDVFRAYNYTIPNNINLRFYGISIKFNSSNKNINSIYKFLLNHKYVNLHLNIYIIKIINNYSINFLKYIIYNFYNRISLTLDEKLSFYSL